MTIAATLAQVTNEKEELQISAGEEDPGDASSTL
jgi:hypothetical protein